LQKENFALDSQLPNYQITRLPNSQPKTCCQHGNEYKILVVACITLMGRLSTHVLDVARGKPAAGIAVRLYSCQGNERRLLQSATTNADGRTDEPLLSGNDLTAGIYELVFNAADYHRAQGQSLESPPLLDQVVVSFGISDPDANYHVPLLLSPYGYSTYRGS
jgi:5-hydroxyisourate hydrolase